MMQQSKGARGHAAALAGIVLAMSAASADAAIAPQYERMHQFGAVMQVGSQAAALLSSHGLIDRIEAVSASLFRFWAKSCYVPVTLTIERQPPDPRGAVVGAPNVYVAKAGAVVCR